ncbi:MAG TPA: choice-of-anchor Q domain-containing protein [Casimicrobium sp.]|nr:choice-of-anchor Q domain-containing protein [Casimicrobium sp.]
MADDVFPDATGAIFDYAGAPVVLASAKCTLRMALASANLDMAVGGATFGCAAGSGADTVSLNSLTGVIQLADRSMSVGPNSPEPVPNTSILDAVRATTITGPGAATLAISGQTIPSFGRRLLTVSDGSDTTDTPFALSGLTLQYGRAIGTSAGCFFSRESTTLTDVVFDGCESIGNGVAGVYPVAGGFGGAMGMGSPISPSNTFPSATLTNVVFKNNRASRGTTSTATSTGRPDNGAAFFGSGTVQVGAVTITNSRFLGNSAERGGAFQVFNASSVSVTNTDVVSNAATGFAAIGGGRYGGFNIGAISGNVSLNQARVVGNTANEERAGFSIQSVGGVTTINDSAVVGNRAINGRIGGFEVLTDVFDVSGNCLGTSKHDVNVANTLIRGNIATTNTGGFRVVCSGNVAMSNSDIEGNEVIGSALAGSGGNSAGNFSTNTSVVMSDVVVAGNRTNAGAVITVGVANGGYGVLTVFDAQSFTGERLWFHDNYAAENEAGLSLRPDGAGRNFTVVDSSFTGNRSKAIHALLLDSTGNYALKNSTISGNSSTGTGGQAMVFNATAAAGTNALLIENVTSARNGPTTNAFGVSNWGAGAPNATVTVRNSIFGQYQFGNGWGPVANPVIAGVTYSYANTIVENIGNMPAGACGTNGVVCGVDAKLEGLNSNGGASPTHGLQAGSPALDTGDNAFAAAFDQRGAGFPRVVNGTIDMGAFESPVLAGALACKLDMDGDSQPRAHKEGLVLLRAMLGFTGSAVIINGTGISQPQWDAARNNLNANCGTSFAP